MNTMAEALSADANRIKGDIRILLGEHSRVSPRPEYDSALVILSGDHCWEELSVGGCRLQAKILKNYKTYRDLVYALIRGLTDESQSAFTEADELIRRHIEQEHSTYCKTPEEAMTKTLAAFDTIETIIDRLYSPDGVCLAVPDTNALLIRPDLDGWQFEWCDPFEIIFTPTMLSEFDDLKVSHRNPDVRAKAESVIRRIKELGRRGDLHAGVPVVTDHITARSVAVEPNVGETLPWLDATNNDDRFLASVIEITRENTRSIVTIVTGDINLQNKARFARMPFCEPPTVDGKFIKRDAPCQ